MSIETVSDAISAAEAELSGQAAAGGGAEAAAPAATDATAAAPVELPPLEPHKDWTKEMQEAFREMAATPEKGRTWAERTLNQYGQLDKRFRETQSRHDSAAAFISQFQNSVGPYLQHYHMQGITPIQGIQRALAWESKLSQNPKEALRHLAQTLGVDLKELTDQSSDVWVDPAVKQMQEEWSRRIQGLESQLGGFNSYVQQQQQASLISQIEAFATQKDATGNLIAPYFQDMLNDDQLTQELGQLVRAGYDLATAYRMVEFKTESIQAKKQEMAAKAAEGKAKKEAAERLAQTTRAEAASAVTKAPAGKGAPAKKATMSFDEAFSEGLKQAKK